MNYTRPTKGWQVAERHQRKTELTPKPIQIGCFFENSRPSIECLVPEHEP